MNGNSQASVRPARNPRGMVARVNEHVRVQLVIGGLPTGSQVVPEQLAEDLGVPRAPVREALNRLVQEELVHVVSGSGFDLHTAQMLHEHRDPLQILRSGTKQQFVQRVEQHLSEGYLEAHHESTS